MHTKSGTSWLGIPTVLDKLFYPSISLAQHYYNATFIVRDKPAFVVSFRNVQALSAFEETPYWSLAETSDRPHHALNIIPETPLLRRLQSFLRQPSLVHYLLCGGDMCAEIVADGFAIEELADASKAEAFCAGRMTGAIGDVPQSDWIASSAI